MKKSGRKTTTGTLYKAVRRSSAKKPSALAKTTLLSRTRQVKTGPFHYRILPFVKKLSRKNANAARVLEESYKMGGAAA